MGGRKGKNNMDLKLFDQEECDTLTLEEFNKYRNGTWEPKKPQKSYRR